MQSYWLALMSSSAFTLLQKNILMQKECGIYHSRLAQWCIKCKMDTLVRTQYYPPYLEDDEVWSCFYWSQRWNAMWQLNYNSPCQVHNARVRSERCHKISFFKSRDSIEFSDLQQQQIAEAGGRSGHILTGTFSLSSFRICGRRHKSRMCIHLKTRRVKYCSLHDFFVKKSLLQI